MPKDKTIKCPFFLTRSRKEKTFHTITCDLFEKNIGFDIRNQIVFRCYSEQCDYVGLFCADQFRQCPYYRAIERRTLKDESSKKSEECGKIIPDSMGKSETKGK